MQNYRSLRSYANSDLGEFRNLLFNIKPQPLGDALKFGTAFHGWVLENIEPQNLTSDQMKQASAMREAVLANKFGREALESATAEVVNIWKDSQTGLPCKGKMDLLYPDQSLIVDIKTTSCRTYASFLTKCEEYAYDRQSAFYLDGLAGAKRVVLLGVQKQEPFSVFYFEATSCPGFIKQGRKKYSRLLRGIQTMGFTPSSWATDEPVDTSLSLPFLIEAA